METDIADRDSVIGEYWLNKVLQALYRVETGQWSIAQARTEIKSILAKPNPYGDN